MSQYLRYRKSLDIRWADLDPNFHVLHSKYYDFGAYCRMSFMTENGLDPAFLKSHHIGPIIFREQCYFRKEINFGDALTIDMEISSMSTDGSRWSMKHDLWINDDVLAAKIDLDGAWLNTLTRKLTAVPESVMQVFHLAYNSNEEK